MAKQHIVIVSLLKCFFQDNFKMSVLEKKQKKPILVNLISAFKVDA